MTPAEAITFAIAKLEELKAASQDNPVPGVWTVRNHTRGVDVLVTYPDHPDQTAVVAEHVYRSDAILIVTLHRTIDAQLRILRAASLDEYEAEQYWEEQGRPHLRGPAKIVPINRAALDLAEAILGDTQ